MVDILPTVAGIAGIAYRNTTLGRDLLRQQEIDGGRSNAAFVIDRHGGWIGTVKGSHYGRHQIDGSRPQLVWADFTRPQANDPAGDDYRTLTNGLFETSRHLLLNNRKKDVVSLNGGAGGSSGR